MAAPNLISPTAIYGETSQLKLTSTTETDFITNAASSGKSLRVASLYAVNVDGVNAVDCTIKLYDAATGGNAVELTYNVTVPANATVTIITADAFVYLMEDRRISVQASAANALSVVASYEVVS